MVNDGWPVLSTLSTSFHCLHSSAFPRSRLSSGYSVRRLVCVAWIHVLKIFCVFGKQRGCHTNHAHPWGSALQFQMFSAVGAVPSLDGEKNGDVCPDLEPPRIGCKKWLWNTLKMLKEAQKETSIIVNLKPNWATSYPSRCYSRVLQHITHFPLLNISLWWVAQPLQGTDKRCYSYSPTTRVLSATTYLISWSHHVN